MVKSIEDRFNAIEARRVALVDRVRALDHTKQNVKPAGSFSPVEIVEHLALMESYNTDFLDRTPPVTLAGDKTTIRIMGNMVLKGLKDPSKFMSRTLPAAIPRAGIGVETAAVHWSSVRIRLREHFHAVSDPDAAFIKMDWLFGTWSANQFMDLIESHMNYHEKRFPV